MHGSTHVDDGRFEHAVCRRVRDHDRGELVGVRVELRAQIAEVDVAVVIARHDDHPHTRHRSARSVGAVGRCRDQADVSFRTAVSGVERADRK